MLKLKLKNIIYIILYTLPNAVLSFGTLYIINNTIAGNPAFLQGYMWIVFFSVIIYSYLLNIIFQKKLNQYTYEILYETEKNIFKQILRTPLITLEKLGSHRFYTTIEDIRIFRSFSGIVTHTVNSLSMLILCLTYMFYISFYSALIVLGLIVVLAATFFFVIKSMTKKISILRKKNENYYSYVHDVVKGFKELKVDRNKRDNLLNKYLNPNRDESKELDYKINFISLSINLISQYGLYAVIGAILFLFPALNLISLAQVGPYVITLLFMSGPINNLINMQHMYSQYIVSNARIKKFLKDFANEDDKEDTLPTRDSKNNFDSVELKDICFNYTNNEAEDVFGIGPINLKINRGEVIFIIGGNGSGKSTFINILTGLYQPSSGNIILNDQSGVDYQLVKENLIAAIFTDNYLFSYNYDNYSLEQNEMYKELLAIMEMDNVVADDKDESARRAFSKGQSKRMSMIFSILENKPVLVLDEWAADQDPYFRKYFYENVLTKLKKEGKTIIAVTHDDAYFKHADRVLKFDYGKIVNEFTVKGGVLSAKNVRSNEVLSE